MVGVTSAAAGRSYLEVRPVVRGILVRRPEAWLYVVAAAAGATILGPAVLRPGGELVPEHSPSWPVAWGGWMLMVLAMMLPVVAPEARRVAMRSLWSRRHRAMAGYLAGYLAVWAGAGTVMVGVLHVANLAHPPAAVTVAALLGAALWQTSATRRRLLRRCGALRLGAASGRAADIDCARAGWRAGQLCALTCGPVMVVMAVGHHYPVLMVALLVLLLSERAPGPNPESRAGRPLEALGLAGLAVLVAVAALAAIA